MSMLPDGAEMQVDDWTIFFLNQTPFNTISPVVGLDSPDLKASKLAGEDDDVDDPDLLCVLNLVRTKHDKTLNRCVRRVVFISLSYWFNQRRQSTRIGDMYPTSLYPNIQSDSPSCTR